MPQFEPEELDNSYETGRESLRVKRLVLLSYFWYIVLTEHMILFLFLKNTELAGWGTGDLVIVNSQTKLHVHVHVKIAHETYRIWCLERHFTKLNSFILQYFVKYTHIHNSLVNKNVLLPMH